MSSAMKSEIRRCLHLAIVAIQEDKHNEFLAICNRLNCIQQNANDILEVVIERWREFSNIPSMSLSSSSTTIYTSDHRNNRESNCVNIGTSSEILRVALNIKIVANNAMIACIECIQEGIISGRSAIFCLSEIRIALLSTVTTASSHSMNDNEDISEFISIASLHVFEVAMMVIQPFLSNSNSESIIDSSDLQQGLMCLDLLPAAITVLYGLKKNFRHFIDNAWSNSSSFACKNGSAVGMKDYICLIDTLLHTDWLVSCHVPLYSIITELYPFFKPHHLQLIKDKIVSSIPMYTASKDTVTDFVGIMKTCLRFLEQSNDHSWMHLLRVLYKCMPASEAQNIEGLLEQVLSLNPNICHVLVNILEDTAVHLNRSICTKSYKQRVVQPTHIKYDEIPVLSIYDIRLLQLITHTLKGQSMQLEISLPSILLGYVTEDVLAIRLSRAVLTLVLTCYIILNFDKDIMHMYASTSSSSSSSHGSDYTSFKSFIIHAIGGRNDDTSGGSWTTSMRVIELIAMCIDSSCYPYVTDQVVAMIQSMNKSVASGNTAIDFTNINDYLVTCLLTLFESNRRSQLPLLSLAVRGISSCVSRAATLAPRGALKSAHDALLKDKLDKAVLHATPDDAVYRTITTAKGLFVTFFQQLCDTQPYALSELETHMHNYISILSNLPVIELECLLFPLARVTRYSHPIFSYLLSCYRKCLLHSQACRKVFAIKALVHLLKHVPVACQSEVVQSLLYAFSLSLQYRRVLYSELIAYLQWYSSSVGSSVGSSMRQQLSSSLLELIQVKVHTILSSLYVSSSDDLCTSFIPYEHQSKKSLTLFSSYRCIEAMRSSNTGSEAVGVGLITVTEDASQLLLLSWMICTILEPVASAKAIVRIAAIISMSSASIYASMKPQVSTIELFSEPTILVGKLYDLVALDEAASSIGNSELYLFGAVRFIVLGMPQVATDGAAGSEDYQLCHLVCCYSVVCGLLRCLQVSLDTNDDAVCVQNAVVVLQCLVDMLLEITASCKQSICGHSAMSGEVAARLDALHSVHSSSVADGDVDTYATASEVDVSVCCNALKAAVVGVVSRLSVCTDAHIAAVETESISDDSAAAGGQLLLPLSCSIGAVGYASFETTQIATLCGGSKLLQLLNEVHTAYDEVASIRVEDRLLHIATTDADLVHSLYSRSIKDSDNGCSMGGDGVDADTNTCAANYASVSVSFYKDASYVIDPHAVDDGDDDDKACVAKYGNIPIMLLAACVGMHKTGSKSSTFKSLLHRWDIDALSSQYVSIASAKRRYSAAWDAARSTIFSCRNELLWANADVLRHINRHDCRASSTSTASMYLLCLERRLELAHYWSGQLELAVKEGLTVRSFSAYLDVIHELAVKLNGRSSTTTADILIHSPIYNVGDGEIGKFFNGISDQLQRVIYRTDSSQMSLMRMSVKLLMSYSGWRVGLQRFEVMLNKISQTCGFSDTAGDGDSDAVPTMSIAAADSILGEMLKIIDNTVQIIGKPFIYGNAVTGVESIDASDSEIIAMEEIACRCCTCIFWSFELSCISSGTVVGQGRSNNATGMGISDRRKGQALLLVVKYISKCIAECSKLSKATKKIKGTANRVKVKYTDTYSDSDIDDDDSDTGDSDRSVDVAMKNCIDKNYQPHDITNTAVATVSACSDIPHCHFLSGLLQLVQLETLISARDFIVKCTSSGSGSERSTHIYKYAHDLAYKMEELEWSLLDCLQSIDLLSTRRAAVTATSPILSLVSSTGRALLLKLRSDESIDKNRKRKHRVAEDNDGIEVEYESEVEEDFIDEEHLSRRSSVAIMRAAKVKSGKSSRLRSRNSVIDDWLQNEDGDDAYADLENFIE